MMNVWLVSELARRLGQNHLSRKLVGLAEYLFSTLRKFAKLAPSFLWSRFRWSSLRAIGSSQVVRMGSALMGGVGYIVLLSEEVRTRLSPVADYAAVSTEPKVWTYDWVTAYRWEFLFIGFLALTLGSIIFLLCPRVIKKYSDAEAYATSEFSVYDLSASPNLSLIRELRENINALRLLGSNPAAKTDGRFAYLKDDISRGFHNTFYNTVVGAMVFPESRIKQPTLPNKIPSLLSLDSNDPIPPFIEETIKTYGRDVSAELKTKVRENALKRWRDFKIQFRQIFGSCLDSEFSRKIRATYFLGSVSRQIVDENLMIDGSQDSYLRPKFMQGDYQFFDKITIFSFVCGILFYFGILLVAIPSAYTSWKVFSVVSSKVFGGS
jgi:hypothetical protein